METVMSNEAVAVPSPGSGYEPSLDCLSCLAITLLSPGSRYAFYEKGND